MFFGVVVCKIVLCIDGFVVWGCVARCVFSMFSYEVEVSMENFLILSKVSVKWWFAQVDFDILLSVSLIFYSLLNDVLMEVEFGQVDLNVLLSNVL